MTSTTAISATAATAAGRHQRAARHAVEADSSHLHFIVADTTVDLTLPPPDKLAFYAGLGAAAAFGLIEWPIALITGVGHLLMEDRRNRTLRALGEALDAV
jgi:hypothetical protein